ncbi:MAG: energy-coupled thiamine transporter ThiT [Lachnospiraceae bacterium]
MMWKLFATQYVNDWDEVCYQPTALGYATLVIVGLLCIGLAVWIVRRSGKGGKRITTRQIMFSAMAMALATVTSMIKLFDAPMGGSVTLCSMLFIVLIGYWYGPYVGILTGVAYGMLQLIIDPYILSLPQLIVDYPLAFGALGVSGFFANSKNGLQKGYVLGIFGRWVFAFLSGCIFFAYYAWDGWNPAAYSAVYNLSYIGIEGVITLILISLPPVKNALVSVKKLALDE